MFENKKRIIVKIGSNLLVKNNQVNKDWLQSLVDDVVYFRKLGKEVIIVTSGAIALGKKSLGKRFLQKTSALTLKEKQAACSIGQIELMSCYKEIFSLHNLTIAQILLTGSDTSGRETYLNAKNTFLTLLKNGIIPIVNENDTVATQEIKIGDNDRLAARVAQMVDADLLILLSDVDGLYEENPSINPNAKFISLIEKIDKNIEAMASDPISSVGSGGMITKIKAAKMAFNSGCDTVITNGFKANPLKTLFSGSKHSLFKSQKSKINSRKTWIADNFHFKGEVVINDCAVNALLSGSSLLPVGVEKIIGKFEEGDNLLVKDLNDNQIARGISSYSYNNAKLIIGKNTSQIKEILGLTSSSKIKEELIHRNNLVIIKNN